ncbi:putative abscisic acid receptor PYL2-like, partial [Capsicum annuum]
TSFHLIEAALPHTIYVVSIIDNLKDSSVPLKIHCQSKNNDLGYHDLLYNQSFEFRFKEQFFHRTLFFCHFWWNAKQNVFDVFNDANRCIKKGPSRTHTCIWSVNLDGFSLNGVKIYKWP